MPEGAVQLSPLVPGGTALEDLAPGSLPGLTMLAPPGTLERRHVLALGSGRSRPAQALTVLAPKDRGGSRLARELSSFGCRLDESAKSHHRIVRTMRPDAPTGLDEAIARARRGATTVSACGRNRASSRGTGSIPAPPS